LAGPSWLGSVVCLAVSSCLDWPVPLDPKCGGMGGVSRPGMDRAVLHVANPGFQSKSSGRNFPSSASRSSWSPEIGPCCLPPRDKCQIGREPSSPLLLSTPLQGEEQREVPVPLARATAWPLSSSRRASRSAEKGSSAGEQHYAELLAIAVHGAVGSAILLLDLG
jgi:hypothetical protein